MSIKAIEAGAEAIYLMAPWRKNTYDNQTYSWEDLTPEDRETFTDEATAALTAAAPFTAAQALREAADAFLDSGTIGRQWVARELNARAATKEPTA